MWAELGGVGARHAAGTIELADGRRVCCRRATADDAELIVALYEALSDESRYLRFCQAVPRITPQLRRSLGDVSGGPIWLALAGDRCVGEARLSRWSTDADRFDLALCVAEDHRGVGLGRSLCRLVLAEPPCRDITISIDLLAGNRVAAAMARRSGLTPSLADGMLHASFRSCG